MCGRISLTASLAQIKDHFRIQRGSAVLVPRYNIAPHGNILIIKNNSLEFAWWGLEIAVASHHDKVAAINAKIETVLLKKCFKSAFMQHRCLIVVNGFFEWKQVGKHKVPFYVHNSTKEILALGGICVSHRCLILTTTAAACPMLQKIHPRMPVILDKAHYDLWCNPHTPLEQLLNSKLTVSPQALLAYPVSAQVNNPTFDDMACVTSII